MRIANFLILALLVFVSACSDDEPRRRVGAANEPASQEAKEQASNTEFTSARVETDNTRSLDQTSTSLSSGEDPAANLDQEQQADELSESQSSDGLGRSTNNSADRLSSASSLSLRDGSVGYVEWQAPKDRSYENAKVTVVDAKGNRRELEFSEGQQMVLNQNLPDGLYKWDSVVTPKIDPRAMEMLRDVRESGNLAAQQQLIQQLQSQGLYPSDEEISANRQAGAFIVRDGQISESTSDVSGYQDEAN